MTCANWDDYCRLIWDLWCHFRGQMILKWSFLYHKVFHCVFTFANEWMRLRRHHESLATPQHLSVQGKRRASSSSALIMSWKILKRCTSPRLYVTWKWCSQWLSTQASHLKTSILSLHTKGDYWSSKPANNVFHLLVIITHLVILYIKTQTDTQVPSTMSRGGLGDMSPVVTKLSHLIHFNS